MIDKTKLSNKDVLLKVVGIDRAIITKLSSVEDSGVWIQHPGLIVDLLKLAGYEGKPMFFGQHPAVFLSFVRVEWMMLAGEHIR